MTNLSGGAVLVTSTGGAVEWMRPDFLRVSPAFVVLFSAAYLTVFVFAVLNNALILASIYRDPHLRTVTNYFLANLALADITVSLLVLPFTLLANVFSEWQFGPVLCKVIPYLQGAAVGASVNTLATVAVERYIAIVYPQSVWMRPKRILTIIAFIWLIPLCLQIPWAVYFQQQTHTITSQRLLYTTCGFIGPDVFQKGFVLGVVFLTCYLIPLCVLAVFYTLIGIKVWKRSVKGIQGSQTERNIHRSKIRIVRMLMVVTVFFALSWLPLYCIQLLRLFGPSMTPEYNRIIYRTMLPIFQWLGSANSCVNPFIYCFFCEQFRKSIFSLLKNCCPCERNCKKTDQLTAV